MPEKLRPPREGACAHVDILVEHGKPRLSFWWNSTFNLWLRLSYEESAKIVKSMRSATTSPDTSKAEGRVVSFLPVEHMGPKYGFVTVSEGAVQTRIEITDEQIQHILGVWPSAVGE